LPVTSTQRMIPTGKFKPGLSVGQPAPDFELPNHLGETVSFHADRDGARAALLFYRSAVW
jgi:peroxiredoxin